MDEGQADLESQVIDLTQVTLPDLRVLDDSALSNSLRRLTANAKDPRDAVASWNSSI